MTYYAAIEWPDGADGVGREIAPVTFGDYGQAAEHAAYMAETRTGAEAIILGRAAVPAGWLASEDPAVAATRERLGVHLKDDD